METASDHEWRGAGILDAAGFRNATPAAASLWRSANAVTPAARIILGVSRFFVLPRSAPREGPESTATKVRRWKGRLKVTTMLLLVFGGFMGTLVYFFVAVSLQIPPATGADSPFVSDPKNLFTNSATRLHYR
jgi:hypothetical protein